MSYFRDTEIARRTARQHKENHGRLATTRALFDTFGWGTFEFEDMADFDCTYIEQPSFTTGAHIESDEWQEALQDAGWFTGLNEDAATPFPAISGYVTAWEQDDKGFYVGAYCAAHITFAAELLIPVDLSDQFLPQIHHHFRFEGMALKGLGDDGSAADGSASG
jgi:hypothetical protein